MKETADYKNYDYIKVAVKEKRSKDLENPHVLCSGACPFR